MNVFLWIPAEIVLVYVFYISQNLLLLPGFNILYLINFLLSISVIYVRHKLNDIKTAFILNVLLFTSGIAILLALWQNTKQRNIFAIYLIFTLYSLLTNIP